MSEYSHSDNAAYKGYEYFLSESVLYVYEDTHLVFSREIWHDKKETRHKWAEYFIEGLINKSKECGAFRAVEAELLAPNGIKIGN